jgi:hypothetical protein
MLAKVRLVDPEVELPGKIMDRSPQEGTLVPLVKEMLVVRLIPRIGAVVPAEVVPRLPEPMERQLRVVRVVRV